MTPMMKTTSLPEACVRALENQLDPEFFRAFCDPARIALIAHLAASPRPLTVTQAATCCGVHISGVSRHLAVLRRAGVLSSKKAGREVYYELDTDALADNLRSIARALEVCAADAKSILCS